MQGCGLWACPWFFYENFSREFNNEFVTSEDGRSVLQKDLWKKIFLGWIKIFFHFLLFIGYFFYLSPCLSWGNYSFIQQTFYWVPNLCNLFWNLVDSVELYLGLEMVPETTMRIIEDLCTVMGTKVNSYTEFSNGETILIKLSSSAEFMISFSI